MTSYQELFALDGKPTDFDDEDRGRRNTIAGLLEEWSLVQVVDAEKVKEPRAPMSRIKILSHKEKPEWTLVSKYNIGKKRTQ